ncbi:MAG: helix-hairpin-helix domain-containing protein [Alistipes sp.]|nr:helix-hairpin-helix domain-containing protein [Candidatus Minthomonas equi]
MWGKEKNSREFLGKITIFLVMGFVLLQLGVFIRDAFYFKSSVESPERIIHDTVIIKEIHTVSVDGIHSGRQGESTVADVMSDSGPQVPEATSLLVENDSKWPAGKSELPKGDSKWKWDVVELNSADSALLDELPGIGGYYAKQILRYRERLGAFTDVWQLLEIRGMDSARVARIVPRVRIDSTYIVWMNLDTVSEETLARHPYVGRMAAKGIVRLRESLPDGQLSLEDIVRNGILTREGGERFGRYLDKEKNKKHFVFRKNIIILRLRMLCSK